MKMINNLLYGMKKNSNSVVVVLLFLFAFFYGHYNTMNRGPYSQHQWRQSDCLSITQNYYQNNLSFLESEIHWQGEDKGGKVMSEFPIVYYTVGNIWKVTGKHYWVYRLLSFLIVVIGLLYLKRLSEDVLHDQFWAVFIPLFLFTSPLLIYYSNNFIMNAPAFGFALIGSYHLYFHQKTKLMKHLLYGCTLFLLAGLLKVTALLGFFAFGALFLVDVFWKGKNLRQRWIELIPFASTLFLIGCWHIYSRSYTAEGGMSEVFLQGILPIWKLDKAQISVIWNEFIHTLLPQYFNRNMLFILMLGVVICMLQLKKISKGIGLFFLLISVGIGCYLMLFFKVFDVHDYYLTNLLIFIPTASLLILVTLRMYQEKLFNSPYLKICATLIVCFLCYSAAIKTRIKYEEEGEGNSVYSSGILTKKEQDYWRWFHWNHNRTLEDLETIEPYLESLGINKEDRVISMPDRSINISLYLMNRKGYSEFGYRDVLGAERIELEKKWGAKYLIINGHDLLNEPYLQPYLKHKIGETEFVTICKLN